MLAIPQRFVHEKKGKVSASKLRNALNSMEKNDSAARLPVACKISHG